MNLYASLTVIDGRSRLAVADCGSASTAAGAQPDKRNDSVWQTLRARVLSNRLDQYIATGGSPHDHALTATRARQLVSPRERERLACALDAVKVAARTRHATLTSTVPLNLEAARLAIPALVQLSRALRVRGDVDARGVAMTQLLLTDPTSPLYRPGYPAAASEALREALAALGPDDSARRAGS